MGIFTAVKQLVFGGQRLVISTDQLEFSNIKPLVERVDWGSLRDHAIGACYLAACYLAGRGIDMLMVAYPPLYWGIVCLNILTIVVFTTVYLRNTSGYAAGAF